MVLPLKSCLIQDNEYSLGIVLVAGRLAYFLGVFQYFVFVLCRLQYASDWAIVLLRLGSCFWSRKVRVGAGSVLSFSCCVEWSCVTLALFLPSLVIPAVAISGQPMSSKTYLTSLVSLSVPSSGRPLITMLFVLLLYPSNNEVVLGYIGFTLSVCPSVRRPVCPSVHPASHVRSVAPTVLDGSISYLYILSSNFRCVACKVSCKISKFEFLAIFQNLQLWLCLVLTWELWITSMGNHGTSGGISECRHSSCSSSSHSSFVVRWMLPWPRLACWHGSSLPQRKLEHWNYLSICQ